MTDKQKVTTMADSDYVFGNFGGKVGQMSIPDFRSHLYDDSPDDESPELSALKSRISSVEDKNTEQDTRIAALLQDIPWEGYHMNAFTDTGEYHIHGESTDANDGLPILNSGTIDARLMVLDSSLANGTGAKTDICVTQILRLSNRTGGDGHVYVRTAQAATKSQLATPSSTAWGTWEKLMGMFEKNAVTNIADLDTYTTNGMYSGLFADTTLQTLGGLQFTPGDTFLMVTVNGYAASAFGTPQLTQMLYRLPSKKGSGNSSARMYMRTAYWKKDAEPKKWEFANWDSLATASEISGLEAKINNYPEQFVLDLGIVESQTYGEIEAAKSEVAGNRNISFIRFQVQEEDRSNLKTTLIMQWPDGVNTTGQIMFTDQSQFRRSVTGANGVEGVPTNAYPWERTAPHHIAYDQSRRMIQLKDYLKIDVKEVELPLATSLQDGLMSSADKTKLDSVESTANSAQETATAASTAAQEAKSAAETAQSTATAAQSTATAAQEKNAAQDARLDNIEARIEPDIAGRVWNEDNGTPKAESYYGSVKALRDLPKRLGLGRYIVKDDRTRRKLDPNDSHKYLDNGSTANLDGTDGQCMWCWNGFYANIWHEGSRLIKAVTFDKPVGNDISIWIPAGGISWLGAGVMDRTEMKLCSLISDDERYRGGGGTALDASKYSKAPADTTPQISMLGMPATIISTTDFGNYARKRGEGWEANWFVARFVVEFLFEVIMGTENSQEAFNANKDADGLYQGGFGTGVTDMPDWGGYNGFYPVIPTSVGLEAGDGVCLVPYNLPDASGGTYKTFNVPVFFGLVGAGYGHLWQWVRGLIMDAGENQSLVYVAPSMYAAYDPNTVAGKIMVAECPIVSGYITRKSYRGLCCMPTEIGGSPTLRYSDQFYTSAEILVGLRVRAAGGDALSVTIAGASCTYTSYAAKNALANCSAPLCYFEEDPVIQDTQQITESE